MVDRFLGRGKTKIHVKFREIIVENAVTTLFYFCE